MTPEELLKPRYKVIADYPENIFNVGEILPSPLQKIKELTPQMIGMYDKYPHLFKKLEWREERKENEMPDFILDRGKVFEVHKWRKENTIWIPLCDDGNWHYYTPILPITEEEYLKQIK